MSSNRTSALRAYIFSSSSRTLKADLAGVTFAVYHSPDYQPGKKDLTRPIVVHITSCRGPTRERDVGWITKFRGVVRSDGFALVRSESSRLELPRDTIVHGELILHERGERLTGWLVDAATAHRFAEAARRMYNPRPSR